MYRYDSLIQSQLTNFRSLGVPKIWFMPQTSPMSYAFVNTNVESNIEYAFQALALDERRGPFAPTIWAAPINPPKELKQCWFRGVHCDIGGGGYSDQELADISLAWMMTQLESKSLIQFNHDTFWKLIETSKRRQTLKIPNDPMPAMKGWGLGRIHDSMKWYYRLLTLPRIREPRSFTQHAFHPSWLKQIVDFFSQKSEPLLENTHECIHASVGKRWMAEGTKCDALGKWSYDTTKKVWSKPGVEPLREDQLQGLELELAQRWDGIVEKVNAEAASQG